VVLLSSKVLVKKLATRVEKRSRYLIGLPRKSSCRPKRGRTREVSGRDPLFELRIFSRRLDNLFLAALFLRSEVYAFSPALFVFHIPVGIALVMLIPVTLT
jgi:hypothetical protein